MDQIEALRALARYQTHGGYVWAAVMTDGAALCVPCVRENYRQIYRATREQTRDDWAVCGITHSGETDSAETCAHCHKEIWS